MPPDSTPKDLAIFRLQKEYYLVSKNKVVAQVESAKTFLDAAEKYVNGRIQSP